MTLSAGVIFVAICRDYGCIDTTGWPWMTKRIIEAWNMKYPLEDTWSLFSNVPFAASAAAGFHYKGSDIGQVRAAQLQRCPCAQICSRMTGKLGTKLTATPWGLFPTACSSAPGKKTTTCAIVAFQICWLNSQMVEIHTKLQPEHDQRWPGRVHDPTISNSTVNLNQFELFHGVVDWSTLFDFSSEVGPSIAGCPRFEGAESTSTAARHWERQHLLLLLGCRWWNILFWRQESRNRWEQRPSISCRCCALFLFHWQLGLLFVIFCHSTFSHRISGRVGQYRHTQTQMSFTRVSHMDHFGP